MMKIQDDDSVREWAIREFQRLKSETGINQTDLGRALGISQPQAQALLSRRRAVKAPEIPLLERFFGTSFVFNRPEMRNIPLVSEISAGELGEMNEPAFYNQAIAVVGLPHDEYFAMRVTGRSMDKIAVDNSIIIVDQKSKELLNGKFYVFSNNGYGTFKRYNKQFNALEAYSWSGEYEPIPLAEGAMPLGEVKKIIVDI